MPTDIYAVSHVLHEWGVGQYPNIPNSSQLYMGFGISLYYFYSKPFYAECSKTICSLPIQYGHIVSNGGDRIRQFQYLCIVNIVIFKKNLGYTTFQLLNVLCFIYGAFWNDNYVLKPAALY